MAVVQRTLLGKISWITVRVLVAFMGVIVVAAAICVFVRAYVETRRVNIPFRDMATCAVINREDCTRAHGCGWCEQAEWCQSVHGSICAGKFTYDKPPYSEFDDVITRLDITVVILGLLAVTGTLASICLCATDAYCRRSRVVLPVANPL